MQLFTCNMNLQSIEYHTVNGCVWQPERSFCAKTNAGATFPLWLCKIAQNRRGLIATCDKAGKD